MINKIYKKSIPNKGRIKTNNSFEGSSIEKEMEIAMASGQPIQKASISQIFYTQRKDGVLAECDIRTDRFELGQNAQNHINTEFKKRIQDNLEKQNQTNQTNQKTE